MRLFRTRKGEVTPAPEPAPITWPKQLSGASVLDDDARLKLIDDLGLVGSSWCVPLLERALEEETNEAHLHAIERALDACRNVQSSE